jgi:hypothetical protein
MTRHDMAQHLDFTPPDDRYRRLAGLWVGALLGLVYGLVTQLLNRMMLPGVPLYQPPFGAAGNILLTTTAGAFLGILAAWPLSSAAGTAIASAVSAFVVVGSGFISAPKSFAAGGAATGVSTWGVALVSALLFLPFWALLVPLIAALRWGVNRQEEAHRDRLPVRARLGSLLILVLLVALAGTLYLYRPERRAVIANANAMLRAAQGAAAEAWPVGLQKPDVGALAAHIQQPYELEWQQQGIERYRIPRPARNFDSHSAIIARFADGWSLVCIYIAEDEPPICRGFEALPQ